MPAKKAAKKVAAKKAAVKAPAKKVAAKAAKVPAKKAAVKAVKVPAKKAAAKKTAKAIAPTDIQLAAYLNYRNRLAKGEHGDSIGDWLAAEKS